MEEKELAFFGKIAAGVTHEIRNVLAIINESNGLMGDLLAMSKDSPFPNKDRFLRSISKIEAQVQRGVVISSQFNRFAHSVDNPCANIDLNEIVEQTVSLAQRFARLSNIELQVSVCKDPVSLITFPFRLQMALTKAIEAGIAYLPAGGVIHLQIDGARECPCVCMSFKAPDGGTGGFREAITALDVWREFFESTAQLDAVIEWHDGVMGFSISLPKSLHGKMPEAVSTL